jgi:hypothetical protein
MLLVTRDCRDVNITSIIWAGPNLWRKGLSDEKQLIFSKVPSLPFLKGEGEGEGGGGGVVGW